MSSSSDRVQAATRWFSERIPLEQISFHNLFAKKEVPLHRMSWAYYFGGLALLCFVIQVVTGLMLLFYYQPTVADAHASVEYITEYVSGGFLIRNIHTWAASGMILAVLAHVITAFAMKAFEKPREVTWLSGVALLMLSFAFGFTGYLLPWHQIAVNATKVGLQSVEEVGAYLPGALSALPGQVMEVIQGGPAVGQATLSRFFALHVVVLPLGLFAVLGLHVMLVQLHGMSKGVDVPARKSERFFPFFILKDFKVWGIVFLILFILGLALPFEAYFSYPLFEAYEPMSATPDGIKPEWYFFFMYYPLELLPFWMVMIGMNAIIVVLILAPWIFKNTRRATLRWIAIAATAYLVIMTIFGQNIYEFFKGGQ
jgi:cytochrome b6